MKVRIKKLNISDDKLKIRLGDLGFVKDTEVIKLYTSFFKGTSIISIRNYLIALNKIILKDIEVI